MAGNGRDERRLREKAPREKSPRENAQREKPNREKPNREKPQQIADELRALIVSGELAEGDSLG
nr:hypothetical protein [Micromonospora sp. DSM 115978]